MTKTNLTSIIDAYGLLMAKRANLEIEKKNMEKELAELEAGAYEGEKYRLSISDTVLESYDDTSRPKSRPSLTPSSQASLTSTSAPIPSKSPPAAMRPRPATGTWSSAMNRKQAIAIARSRVSMEPLGNQWTVYTWSPKHDATWVSHGMTFWQAQGAVWENRVCTALELLGVDKAGALANAAARNGEDWRKAVRRLAKLAKQGAKARNGNVE